MGKNQGAKKGTVVHLAHLVANDKAHIPDRPQERAPDDQGFFRRDFRGYGSERPQGDRPTFRSEGDDDWRRGGGGGGGFGGGGGGDVVIEIVPDGAWQMQPLASHGQKPGRSLFV